MKINDLTPVFCKHIPAWKEMQPGILYISEFYNSSNHLCACGCGQQTVLPFNKPGEWTMKNNDGKISFMPSIGNFSGERPYHAHYYIRDNKIIWC